MNPAGLHHSWWWRRAIALGDSHGASRCLRPLEHRHRLDPELRCTYSCAIESNATNLGTCRAHQIMPQSCMRWQTAPVRGDARQCSTGPQSGAGVDAHEGLPGGSPAGSKAPAAFTVKPRGEPNLDTIKGFRHSRAWHKRYGPLAPKQGDEAPDFELRDHRGAELATAPVWPPAHRRHRIEC